METPNVCVFCTSAAEIRLVLVNPVFMKNTQKLLPTVNHSKVENYCVYAQGTIVTLMFFGLVYYSVSVLGKLLEMLWIRFGNVKYVVTIKYWVR